MKKIFKTIFLCASIICILATGCSDSGKKTKEDTEAPYSNYDNLNNKGEDNDENNYNEDYDANLLIIGKWSATERQEYSSYFLNLVEFYEDGSAISKEDSGKYKLIDNHLCIYDLGFFPEVVYTYTITNDTLTLKHKNKTVEYVRKFTGEESFLENTSVSKKDIDLPDKLDMNNYHKNGFDNYREHKGDYYSISLPKYWFSPDNGTHSVTNDYGTEITRTDFGTYDTTTLDPIIFIFKYDISSTDTKYMKYINNYKQSMHDAILSKENTEILVCKDISINEIEGSITIYKHTSSENNKTSVIMNFTTVKGQKLYIFNYIIAESIFNIYKDKAISIISTLNFY